jgi:hypothetical protein
MRLRHYSVIMLALLMAMPAVGHATRVRRGPTSPRSHNNSKNSKGKKKGTLAGHRSIDPARATQIQTALVKAGYMTGTPSGQWDSQTAAAMQKMQSDNGWQTKITPDARALIKLGLGPSQTNTAALATPSTTQNKPQ